MAPSPVISVVVTRSPEYFSIWQAQFKKAGIVAYNLPLIAQRANTHPLTSQTRASIGSFLSQWHAIMHVSPAAAEFFWTPTLLQQWHILHRKNNAPRLWSPGLGTAKALERLGLFPSMIDHPNADAPQFDSESLWPQIASGIQSGGRVLILRGCDGSVTQNHFSSKEISYENTTSLMHSQINGRAGHSTQNSPMFAHLAAGLTAENGRNWLADQLHAKGVEVQFLSVYTRYCPTWDETNNTLVQQALAKQMIWIFNSSQAIRNLQQRLSKQNWGKHIALCTHARIAQQARSIGFGLVLKSRPLLHDMVAALRAHQLNI